MDLEYAMWRAAAKVLPQVTVHGCGFHWSQAVFRQLKDRTKATFMKDKGTYVFVKKLLALLYLTAEEIPTVFTAIVQEHQLSSGLQSLVTYVRNNWIESSCFPLPKWSVYNCADRTNNDLEGYHHKLNTDTEKPNLPFYLLLDQLKNQCKDVTITICPTTRRKRFSENSSSHYTGRSSERGETMRTANSLESSSCSSAHISPLINELYKLLCDIFQ